MDGAQPHDKHQRGISLNKWKRYNSSFLPAAHPSSPPPFFVLEFVFFHLIVFLMTQFQPPNIISDSVIIFSVAPQFS